MATTAETLKLVKQLRTRLAQVTNVHSRELVSAWARAWDAVSVDLAAAIDELLLGAASGRITRAAALRSENLAYALLRIADQLETLAADVGVTIEADLRAIAHDAAASQAAIVASQLPEHVDFERFSDDALDAIVRRTSGRIEALTRPLPRDAVRAMRRELVRGVAVGANPRETARLILRRAEGAWNGGLTRALTIARTETLDAHRQAAKVGQAPHADVLAGWTWVAELSRRTCPACLALHGSLHPLSEPGPLGHANCRCARVPKAKTWTELGFDLEEPADLLPDARSWFAAQPVTVQVAVMGQRRLDLLNSGAIAWDDLATRTTAAGWRDYMQVTPVKTLNRRAVA